MKKGLLLVGALVGCLICGTLPAAAYYPPLQVQGSAVGAMVNYEVLDPQSNEWKYGSESYSAPVLNFQQNNGVLGWISQDGASFYVHFLTYDPVRKLFQKNDSYSAGPYAQIFDFTLDNGVAAWRCLLSQGGEAVRFATYSPRYGIWYWSGMDRAAASLLNKDGVVAYFDAEYGVIANIYDAYYEGDTSNGPWRNTNVWNLKATDLAIQNATVSFKDGATTYTVGYSPDDGYWYVDRQTKLRAYFLAQPAQGPLPLWVWFTDMSIAGTSWNWEFGDGNSGTGRSSYHTFTKGGNFAVKQTITGNGLAPSTYTQIIKAGGSLPFLPLLLTN